MSHRFKKVPPAAPGQLSFVKLVTRWGDSWALMVPHYHLIGMEERSPDQREATLMKLMERGELPRCDE